YTDETLRDYLTKSYTNEIAIVEAFKYIDGLLYSMLTANTNLSGIRLYVHNQTLSEDGLFLKHLTSELLETPFLSHIQQTYGNNIFSDVALDDNGNNVIHLGRILNYNTQNQMYGMVTIGLYENSLHRLIEKEEQNKSVYLLN